MIRTLTRPHLFAVATATLIGLVACGARNRTGTVRSTALSVESHSVRSAGPPPVVPLFQEERRPAGIPRESCAAVLEWRQQRLARAAHAQAADTCTIPSLLDGSTCVAGDQGMWALVETAWMGSCNNDVLAGAPPVQGNASGNLALAYIPWRSETPPMLHKLSSTHLGDISATTELTQLLSPPSDNARDFNHEPNESRTAALFAASNWVGDSEHEIVVRSHYTHQYDGGQDASQAFVFSHQRDGIAAFATPAPLHGEQPVVDADHDGTVDLRLTAYLDEQYPVNCVGDGHKVIGPVQIAFGSTHGFTLVPRTDAQRTAAATLLSDECKAPHVTRVLVTKNGEVQHRESLRSAACKRLRGESAASVAAAISRECKGKRLLDECTEKVAACSPALLGWTHQPLLQERHPAF